MLNSLSSTFTTCACGAKSNDCALNMMAAFVDGDVPPTPDSEHVDLGPLVGSSRGFRTREKVPFSGGMTGVEMVPEPIPQAPVMNGDIRRRVLSVAELASNPASPAVPWPTFGKGKERATTADGYDNLPHAQRGPSGRGLPSFQHKNLFVSGRKPSSSRKRRVTTGSVSVAMDEAPEHKMPPKMRKRWIHQSSEALQITRSRDSTQDEGATEDESMEVDSGQSCSWISFPIS